MGSLFGMLMGTLIHCFSRGKNAVHRHCGRMFLARGLCYVISIDSIAITDETYSAISQYRIAFGEEAFLSVSAVIALLVLALAIFLLSTRFGRAVPAPSAATSAPALLMGLPVGRTKILVPTP